MVNIFSKEKILATRVLCDRHSSSELVGSSTQKSYFAFQKFGRLQVGLVLEGLECDGEYFWIVFILSKFPRLEQLFASILVYTIVV